MTRFIHDEFAKDYLEELLKNYGEVKSSQKISGEIKEIDVVFTPAKQQTSNLHILGLLGSKAIRNSQWTSSRYANAIRN